MKKLLVLLLALTLTLFALASCGGNNGDDKGDEGSSENGGNEGGNAGGNEGGNEGGNAGGNEGDHKHSDLNLDFKCDGCDEALPDSGRDLLLAFAEQLMGAKSFKVEFVTTSVNDNNGWDTDGEGNLVAAADYYEMVMAYDIIVAISDDGSVSAKLELTQKMRTEANGEFFKAPAMTSYIIDGSFYEYNEELDAYVCSPIEDDELAAALDEIGAMVGDIEITEEEQNALLADIGNALINVYSISGGKGSFSVELKDYVNALFSYIGNLDLETKTVKDVLNDALALLGEGVNVDLIEDEIFRILDLTVDGLIAEIDAALTAELGVDLQGFYNMIVTEPSVAEAIKGIIAEEYGAEAVDQYYQAVLALDIKAMIAESGIGSAKIYDLVVSIIAGGNGPEDEVIPGVEGDASAQSEAGIPTLADLRATVDAMLSMTLAEFDAELGDGMFAMLKSNLGCITVEELSFKSNIGLVGLNLDYIDFSFKLSATMTQKIDETKSNISKAIATVYVGITEVSTDSIVITLPTDKEVYLDIFDEWYENLETGAELYISLGEEGVDVSLYIYSDEISVRLYAYNLPIEVLKSAEFTIAAEDCEMYVDTSLISGEVNLDDTPFVFTLYPEYGEFEIISMPEPQMNSVAQ